MKPEILCFFSRVSSNFTSRQFNEECASIFLVARLLELIIIANEASKLYSINKTQVFDLNNYSWNSGIFQKRIMKPEKYKNYQSIDIILKKLTVLKIKIFFLFFRLCRIRFIVQTT